MGGQAPCPRTGGNLLEALTLWLMIVSPFYRVRKGGTRVTLPEGCSYSHRRSPVFLPPAHCPSLCQRPLAWDSTRMARLSHLCVAAGIRLCLPGFSGMLFASSLVSCSCHLLAITGAVQGVLLEKQRSALLWSWDCRAVPSVPALLGYCSDSMQVPRVMPAQPQTLACLPQVPSH